MRKILLLLSIVSCCFKARAQEFSFVYDEDCYAYMREEPAAGSPVVDTLCSLQIVRTGRTEGGWKEIIGTDFTGVGWVHGSRLRTLPEGPSANLRENYFRYDRSYLKFVAGIDVPEVVIRLKRLGPPVVPGQPNYSPVAPLTFTSMEGADAYHASERDPDRKVLWEWDQPGRWVRVSVYPGRVVIQDEKGLFSFIRTPDGRTCLSVTPFDLFRPGNYPRPEIEEAIGLAQELRRRYEAGGRNEAGYLSFGRLEDYEIFLRLHSAYYSGDPRMRDLYPFMLRTMHADASAGESHRWYNMEYLVFTNAGLIDIEVLKRERPTDFPYME